jgi:rhodanese-related sulfurtransferase
MIVATRILGASALLLGLAAPFVSITHRKAESQSLDVRATALLVSSGGDHVTALEVASWIRDRRRHLRIIDVRKAVDYARYSIPTAENISIEDLPDANFSPSDVVVLYSEEGAHAAQAWVLLRALGLKQVYFIGGGLADWRDEVLAPKLRKGASPKERQSFKAVEELSRYFGGLPRTDVADPLTTIALDASGPAAALTDVRRRGC